MELAKLTTKGQITIPLKFVKNSMWERETRLFFLRKTDGFSLKTLKS